MSDTKYLKDAVELASNTIEFLEQSVNKMTLDEEHRVILIEKVIGILYEHYFDPVKKRLEQFKYFYDKLNEIIS